MSLTIQYKITRKLKNMRIFVFFSEIYYFVYENFSTKFVLNVADCIINYTSRVILLHNTICTIYEYFT